MYAIIATGGKQYKVAEGDIIRVEKLGVEAGETVTFDQVLAVNNDGLKVEEINWLSQEKRTETAVHKSENRKDQRLIRWSDDKSYVLSEFRKSVCRLYQ